MAHTYTHIYISINRTRGARLSHRAHCVWTLDWWCECVIFFLFSILFYLLVKRLKAPFAILKVHILKWIAGHTSSAHNVSAHCNIPSPPYSYMVRRALRTYWFILHTWCWYIRVVCVYVSWCLNNLLVCEWDAVFGCRAEPQMRRLRPISCSSVRSQGADIFSIGARRSFRWHLARCACWDNGAMRFYFFLCHHHIKAMPVAISVCVCDCVNRGR